LLCLATRLQVPGATPSPNTPRSRRASFLSRRKKSDRHLNTAAHKLQCINDRALLSQENGGEFLSIDPGAESNWKKAVSVAEYRGYHIVLGSKFCFRHAGRDRTSLYGGEHTFDVDEFDATPIDVERWTVVTC